MIRFQIDDGRLLEELSLNVVIRYFERNVSFKNQATWVEIYQVIK